MAVCAIADAMYAYAQLEAGNGAVQSVSIGSVSENRAAVPAPGTRPAAIYVVFVFFLGTALLYSSGSISSTMAGQNAGKTLGAGPGLCKELVNWR